MTLRSLNYDKRKFPLEREAPPIVHANSQLQSPSRDRLGSIAQGRKEYNNTTSIYNKDRRAGMILTRVQVELSSNSRNIIKIKEIFLPFLHITWVPS